MKRAKKNFREYLEKKMKWIRSRLTPEGEENKQTYTDLIKALSLEVKGTLN